MLNLFKQNAQERPQDVKTIRDSLLTFIKDELRKVEGGEGSNIKGMELFIACSDAEKHLYEAAVYVNDKDKFRNEDVQRIADDYAIDLPEAWTFETTFTDALPPDAIPVPGTAAALFIQTRKRSVHKAATAFLRVLNGEAEKEVYTISSTSGKINIGREKRVQTASGFFRENHIAFPEGSGHESNKYISRQHAHIAFDDDSGNFLLYADEGGLPPRNKIKVRSAHEENPVKLYTTKIGHPLQDGDQIMLGESAILEFSYSNEGV